MPDTACTTTKPRKPAHTATCTGLCSPGPAATAAASAGDPTVTLQHGVPPGLIAPPVSVRQWPRTAASVPHARHHLRDVLGRWNLSALAPSAELVITELVTNAVQHTHPTGRLIEVRYQPQPGTTLWIEVHDADDRAPLPGQADPDAEFGRGLTLVNAVTGGAWGVLPRSPREGEGAIGKVIWARIGPTT